MARQRRFTFLVNDDERRMITALARSMQRTESDAVREVVLEAARAVAEKSPQQHPARFTSDSGAILSAGSDVGNTSTSTPRSSWSLVIDALAELGAKEIARRKQAAALRTAVQRGDLLEVDRLLREHDARQSDIAQPAARPDHGE